MQPLFAVGFDSLFGPHLLILLIIGILLFGKRLPEVGRSLGKGIVEFKKGLKGLEDDIDSGGNSSQNDSRAQIEPPRPPQRVQSTAPKFEDPATPPKTPPQA